MPRCIDCHWYEIPPPAARNPESCRDLGELAQNQACGSFTKRKIEVEEVTILEPLPLTTVEAKEGFVGALLEENYRTVFHEIIAENFVLEQDADLAVKTIQAQLQTQGAKVEMPAHDFIRYAAKLTDLYVLHRLVMSIGLGSFADDIIRAEIKNKFRPVKDE